jgi:hypothetical protein
MRTFVSGLLLSAICLLPVSLRAAEVQPFFSLKLASVNSFVGVIEKVASMAGAANDAQVQDIVRTIKNLEGYDLDNITGIAVAASDDGTISPILLLPITDIWKAQIPSMPMIFDTIRPFLAKNGDKTEINSPLGTFAVIQKQGYLVIVPEGIASQIPADPKKLFADLDKYTLGVKLDFRKVDFETIEANLFGPLIFLATMQNPDAGEQLESVLATVKDLYKEFSVLSGGVAIDPKTADIEISGTGVPRQGSDTAKFLAGYKQQPTAFSGFRGTPGNIVFSVGDSATQPPSSKNPLLAPITEQLKTILDGAIEQIEMEDETGNVGVAVREVTNFINGIVEADAKRGVKDFAVSLDTNGTLLLAFETGSLADIRNFVEMAMQYAQDYAPSDLLADLAYDFRSNFTTVEGFEVSGTKVPIGQLIELIRGSSPGNFSLPVFWAIKDSGGKQAVAFAMGIDQSRTEEAFISALKKTKTPVAVQKPQAVFDVNGLGRLLQPVAYEIDGVAAGAGNAIDALVAAGSGATISFAYDMKPDKAELDFRVSGKSIQAVLSLFRLAANMDLPFDLPELPFNLNR